MMATKKIRLDRRAITEVLVADTDSESDAEASNDEEFYIHAGQYGPTEKTCPLTSDQKKK